MQHRQGHGTGPARPREDRRAPLRRSTTNLITDNSPTARIPTGKSNSAPGRATQGAQTDPRQDGGHT
jgi:hypothetical protein